MRANIYAPFCCDHLPALDQSTTIPILSKFLFDTYPFYTDRPSRRAVQSCLASIFATAEDPKLLAPFLAALRQESQKPGIAPNNAFVLVEWCSILLIGLAGSPLWSKFGLEIVQADAAALEKCCQSTPRSSISASALVVTRRGLRAAFWKGGLRKEVIEDVVQALTAKGPQPTTRNAVLLGVVAGVCSRHAQAKDILAAKKADYFTFFTREIIGSRTPVLEHITTGLRDFFSAFVTQEDLEKTVMPPIEKGLLRAPEVVLGVVAPLLQLLPKDIDLSKALASHLLKPLLSNVKSTNPAIRASVLTVFKAASASSHDSKTLEQVSDEVLNPLKSGKLASADHRILHAEMLESVPLNKSVSTKIVTGLAPIAAKEGNEGALAAETRLLGKAVIQLLNDGGDIPKAVLDVFTKGLADKKVPARRLWLLQAGEILLSFADASQPLEKNVTQFAESIAAPLCDTWTEILKNPPAAAQSGLIVGAYVFTVLSYRILGAIDVPGIKAVLKKAAVSKESLVAEPKPSYLLNHRVFGRLTSEDDGRWFLRSLGAVADDVSKSSNEVQIAWSQALIYLVSSTSIPPKIRKEACGSLSLLYTRNPEIVSRIVIDGLWQWIESSDLVEKESVAATAKFEMNYLHSVLRAICLNEDEFKQFGAEVQDQTIKEKQMCSLLVISRDDLIPRSSWIESCLRIGVDPGSLAKKYEENLTTQVVERTSPNQKVSFWSYNTLYTCLTGCSQT